MIEYTNTDIGFIIDNHIHHERNRQILKRRFIDGVTYERIAEEFDLSPRHVKTIVYRNEMKIFRYL